MSRFNQPLGGNEMPRFGGPATMMRLPAQPTAEGLERQIHRTLLTALQRDHWGKRVLLPWVRRRRLQRNDDGELVPRRSEARA